MAAIDECAVWVDLSLIWIDGVKLTKAKGNNFLSTGYIL
jgi:hypothetical protein